MHLGIWSQGNVSNEHEGGRYILKCMCDLTKFILSCILIEARSEALSKFCIEQMTLIFRMVVVVDVDADSWFQSNFDAMCKVLKLTFWPLSRGNHKGKSVERYHRFLNKTQIISGQDRETHEVFHQNR